MQFVAAQKLLLNKHQQELNLISQEELIQAFLSHEKIAWQFVTPNAPWRGGFYERMVGLVKVHILRVVGKNIFDIINFTTLLVEIKHILNSRPITYVSENVNNLRPLRPLDFLMPAANTRSFFHFSNRENDDFVINESTNDTVMNLWRTSARKLDKFWCSWKRDYLMSLREKDKSSKFIIKTPSVGEVVLIFDENIPRNFWKLGLILKCCLGEDGLCRTALVRLANGRKMLRPVNKLYALEI